MKSRISAAASAAVLVCLVFAGPAGADGLPGSGSGSGSSVLPGDPLGGVADPIDRILPGDSNLGDPLGGGLGNVPLTQPKNNKSEPGNGSTNSSPPKSSAPRSKAPAKRISRPSATDRTPSNGSHRAGASSSGPAGPLGAKHVADTERSFNREAFIRPTPKSPPAVRGPAVPNSFVGAVIDRIPPQYRWPVLVLACLAVLFAFTSLRERRRSLRVERAALVDSLTGLPNRSAFERRLAKEWRRSERYDRPLGLLLIDLDDFKHVNDTQGHAAGDGVLREVAAAISGRIRLSDMAARLGGDEFVVLCPETPIDGLRTLANGLEDRLQEASIKISVGFTEREPADEDPDHFVERADAAMYRRKQSTREHSEPRGNRLLTPQPLVGTAAD